MEPALEKHLFVDFIAKFPPVAMPVTLGEDTHHVFSQENEPLPESMVGQFILPVSGEEAPDEFTEHVPCFSIEGTDGFVALVWWKAALMEYQYYLATFLPTGKLIDLKVIAFTNAQADRIRRAVATIDEDWEIYVAEGESAGPNDYFDPTTSKTYTFEILSNGEIVG